RRASTAAVHAATVGVNGPPTCAAAAVGRRPSPPPAPAPAPPPRRPAAPPPPAPPRGRVRRRVARRPHARGAARRPQPARRRLSGLGWRNILCETAFVARGGEGGAGEGDMDALAARWPAWHARLAAFLIEDPLRPLRERLARLEAEVDGPQRQQELFPADGHGGDAGAPGGAA